jgi:predicted amidohydrolase
MDMPMEKIRIAAAQTSEHRNDVAAAVGDAVAIVARAEAAGARLVCFAEGYLQGYLTEPDAARQAAIDLFSSRFEAILHHFRAAEPTIVMGMIEKHDDALFNTAIVIRHGRLLGRYRKKHLLNGERAFRPGSEAPVFEVDGLTFGIAICNDTNFPETARQVASGGASLLVCCANNMMPRARAEQYRLVHNAVRGERCREAGMWLISADVTGERGDRVAWGPTAVLNPAGEVAAQLPLDKPGLLVFDLPI